MKDCLVARGAAADDRIDAGKETVLRAVAMAQNGSLP